MFQDFLNGLWFLLWVAASIMGYGFCMVHGLFKVHRFRIVFDMGYGLRVTGYGFFPLFLFRVLFPFRIRFMCLGCTKGPQDGQRQD